MKRPGTRVSSRPGTLAPTARGTRQVGPEREDARHGDADEQRCREPVAALKEHGDGTDHRDERQHPAEEDGRLEPVPRVAGNEVEQVGRVALDLRERAAAGSDRAANRRDVDGEGAEHGGQGAARHAGDPDGTAKDGVEEEEGTAPSARCTWPERGMEASSTGEGEPGVGPRLARSSA